MPDGLHKLAASLGIEPICTGVTGRGTLLLVSIFHTGHAVPAGARPVVYRKPALSPVRPSMANGVMLRVVKVSAELPGSPELKSAASGDPSIARMLQQAVTTLRASTTPP